MTGQMSRWRNASSFINILTLRQIYILSNTEERLSISETRCDVYTEQEFHHPDEFGFAREVRKIKNQIFFENDGTASNEIRVRNFLLLLRLSSVAISREGDKSSVIFICGMAAAMVERTTFLSCREWCKKNNNNQMGGCLEVKTRARTRDFDHDHLAAFF